MKRIKLRFIDKLEIEFIDREQALKRVVEWAEKGMINVQVVYGPEGCGKTAWLKQSIELLKELDFDIIYINPVEREFHAEIGIRDIRTRLLEIVRGATEDAWGRVAWAVIDAAKELIKAGRKRLAILADDVFQAIGLDRASIYVKGLLGLIEYPPGSYDVIIAVVATSEGISRYEIGRHRWADILAMWNIGREGFYGLYNRLPNGKPGFEEIWRITGGNPKTLAEIYGSGWNIEIAVERIISRKGLRGFIQALEEKERIWLEEAIENPDTLFTRERIAFMKKLVELNLVVGDIPERRDYLWIDDPPPDKDPEIGVGRYVAWQTPLYREAVRIALQVTREKVS
ncbi:MAG: ATP-binding protein [Sulfolobales archaeon]